MSFFFIKCNELESLHPTHVKNGWDIIQIGVFIFIYIFTYIIIEDVEKTHTLQET